MRTPAPGHSPGTPGDRRKETHLVTVGDRAVELGIVQVDRHQQVFNVRAAIEKGITVGFGSDFPSSLVPEPNSFFYMEGWVTRKMPGTDEYGTVNAGQAISVEQAVRGFTLGGAEALGGDYSEQFGSIEAGKSADMIVLSQDLLEIAGTDIHRTEVQETIFRGKVVYQLR